MNDSRLGLDLTALMQQAIGDRFRERLGNADGYRITILQNGEPISWMNLTSISRLTLEVTGWGVDVPPTQ